MNSRGNSIARARAIYDGRLNAQSTQQMRGHLETQAAESSALLATSALCDYLNRWNDAGADELAKAETAVHHALRTKPDHYLGHYAKGFLHRTRGEHEEALAAFTETVKHNPSFARAHAQRGAELLYLGRPDECIAEVEKAIALRPKSPSLGMFHWIIGRARFFMGQYAEAVPWLQQSVKHWPHLWYNRLYLVSALALLGKKAAAGRTLRAFDQQFPGWTLARVAVEERSNPNNNPFVVAGRLRFHEGLTARRHASGRLTADLRSRALWIKTQSARLLSVTELGRETVVADVTLQRPIRVDGLNRSRGRALRASVRPGRSAAR